MPIGFGRIGERVLKTPITLSLTSGFILIFYGELGTLVKMKKDIYSLTGLFIPETLKVALSRNKTGFWLKAE
jgi:hypothetical protein